MPDDPTQLPLVVYVDVDDTLIRTVGTKRIPVAGAVEHVRSLYADGAQLYCWSSGGGQYARAVAEELGIAACFVAYLPKPHVLLDDQPVSEWRRLVTVHPLQCESQSVATYRDAVAHGRRPAAPPDAVADCYPPQPMADSVPETAIDYDEVFRRGGRNVGDEDFALFKCPACGRIYLLEYEVGTAYLDSDDLSRRADVVQGSFDCVACGRRIPDDEPWIGPWAHPKFGVTWPELEASRWSWVARRPGGR